MIFGFLPFYMLIPVFAWLIANTFTFYGSAFILGDIKRISVKTFIDDCIPLFTPFVAFYIAAYLQWTICFIAISKASKDSCYSFFSGEITGKLISAVIFFIMPTYMERAVITGNGVFDKITSFLYLIDKPITLFPSLHCLESYVCARYVSRLKGVKKPVKILNWIFSCLVFASTVLVKQHLFVDIPAGILIGEAGIFISDKANLKKLFYKAEETIYKKREESRS